MIKANLVEKISSETGLEQTTVKAVVESAMSNIKKSLQDGDAVFLRGFGTFAVKTRKPKAARNIKCNTTIIVPEHKVPTFKPCNSFKDSLK